MPSYVVREAPASGFYLIWSDIVEAPLCGGTRAQVAAFLIGRGATTGDEVEERMARADVAGTSALWPTPWRPYLGWQDVDGTIYEQEGYCPRSRLGELTRRLLAGGNADVSDLLVPFEERA